MTTGSVITRTTRQGATEGVYLTERDLDFVRLAARWWCINPDLYLRYAYPQQEWGYAYLEEENSAWRKNHYRSIRRRMSKFADLDYSPLLHAARVDRESIAYWCSSAGGELIGAPFTAYRHGNVSRAAHAWAAADTGIALERDGLQVYSEREVGSGFTVDGEPVIGGVLGINYLKKDDPQINAVRPDLLITNDEGQVIVVEVERHLGAVRTKFYNKLLAYYGQERIAAVWYLTEHTSIARSIKAAESEVSVGKRTMPVRVMKMERGHHGYLYTPALHGDSAVADLASISLAYSADAPPQTKDI